ncbi:MFS transporter [Rhodococcus sp. LB1]|uniref:MFS transporter n=1 Tax=Rhodococcus sp. LB1 TaxID=1807499 RepID=UPI00077A1054|nr:MFS transporter [Rhodococcus sp. LB1]KXX54219.1 hypothetical protein AZG88_25175 [Rhodococcus sp. LB1]
MTSADSISLKANSARSSSQTQRRAVAASMVGTIIEVFDFVIYGYAAALVFGNLFFPDFSPVAGTLASFATFAAGFISRPLGGIVFAHFGDRIGRKKTLQVSLLLMGGATVLIGALPTYAQVGLAAPVLLVLLRLLQGFAAGGELGGAVLVVLEHTPKHRRATRGAFVFAGGAIGGMLASVVFLLASLFMSPESFEAWGWRLPFLLSIVVIVVGYYVRLKLEETPEFTDVAEKDSTVRIPLVEVLRHHKRVVLLVAGATLANTGVGFLLLTFTVSYLTSSLGMAQSTGLFISFVTNSILVIAYLVSGRLADRFGRRRIILVGFSICSVWAFPFYLLLDTQVMGLVLLAVGVMSVGMGAYGGVVGTFFAELFPPRIRYSGFSIAYQLATVLGGGISPLVASAIVAGLGGASWGVALYAAALAVFGILCTLGLREAEAPDGGDHAARAAEAQETIGITMTR